MRDLRVIGYADFREVLKTNTIFFLSCKHAVFFLFAFCTLLTAGLWSL